MDATFAIVGHPQADRDVHWYIRGIKPDGTFYGEARSPAAIVNVEGQIPADDWERCRIILNQIASGPPVTPSNKWDVRIGRWRTSLADADIVAGYEHGDEHRSNEGKMFLELKLLLEKQIARFYNTVA